MTVNYVDVFIIEGTDIGGSYRYEGSIYNLREEDAQQLESEKKGKIVKVAPLEVRKEEIKTLTAQMEAELKEVDGNSRLSPQAKRGDTVQILRDFQARADDIQERYAEELRILKNAAQSNFSKLTPETDLDVEEVRTRARLIRTEVVMAFSFDEAIRLLHECMEQSEPAVVRELLSRFIDIKSDLESKIIITTDTSKRVIQSEKVTSVYRELKGKSMTQEQANAKVTADIYKAIEQQHGDVRTDFARSVRSHS